MHPILYVALGLLLASFLHRRHHWRHAWAGRGCGGPPWQRHHHHHHHCHKRRWGRRGRGAWGWPGALFAELDLSPEQEKEVRSIVDTLRQAADPLRQEAGRARADVARALRSADFEESSMEEMYARHDERLAVLRVDINAAVGRLHELLEPRQRERLAEILEAGRGWRRGPYR